MLQFLIAKPPCFDALSFSLAKFRHKSGSFDSGLTKFKNQLIFPHRSYLPHGDVCWTFRIKQVDGTSDARIERVQCAQDFEWP